VQRLARHDVVLAMGAPAFTYHVEGFGPHLPEGAALYQLTEDPHTAAWAPTGTSVVGSLRLSLQDLLARPVPPLRNAPERLPRVPRAEAPRPGERLSVAYLLQTLADLRPRGSIVVEEAPSARAVMHQHLPMLEPESFYTMCSGGLGHGLPAAVGVALAETQAAATAGRPARRVLALIGDGSAMYGIQALWNAAQLKLPLAIVIVKNRRYAALQEFAPSFGFAPGAPVQGCELPDLDFVALAAGHGVQGLRVATADALHTALAQALQEPRPLLLEVEVA
jgi:benzoylformate decarboxylase